LFPYIVQVIKFLKKGKKGFARCHALIVGDVLRKEGPEKNAQVHGRGENGRCILS
jgi:hypothetical protein